MKTFYITIDSKEGTTMRHISADIAITDAHMYGGTPFRIDITEDENGNSHFEFTELKEPKPEYWAQVPTTQAPYVQPLENVTKSLWAVLLAVYIKDGQGNLILLNDEEKAKMVEEWKNS